MDQVSIDEWAKARGSSLKRLAFLLTGNEADADDLVQDVFVKVLTRPKLIQGADDPDAYARRMLINAFLSATRRARVQLRRRHLLTTAVAVTDASQPTIERSSLRHELAQLAPRQRAVIILRYYCDLSVEDVAEYLKCSPSTVRSQAARGLENLRQQALHDGRA